MTLEQILDAIDKHPAVRIVGLITLVAGGSVITWLAWIYRRTIPQSVTTAKPAGSKVVPLNGRDMSAPKQHELKGETVTVTGIVFLTNTDDRNSPYLELRPYQKNGDLHVYCTFPPEDVYRVHRLRNISLATVTGYADEGIQFDSIMRPVLRLSQCSVQRPPTLTLMKFESPFRWW